MSGLEALLERVRSEAIRRGPGWLEEQLLAAGAAPESTPRPPRVSSRLSRPPARLSPEHGTRRRHRSVARVPAASPPPAGSSGAGGEAGSLRRRPQEEVRRSVQPRGKKRRSAACTPAAGPRSGDGRRSGGRRERSASPAAWRGERSAAERSGDQAVGPADRRTASPQRSRDQPAASSKRSRLRLRCEKEACVGPEVRGGVSPAPGASSSDESLEDAGGSCGLPVVLPVSEEWQAQSAPAAGSGGPVPAGRREELLPVERDCRSSGSRPLAAAGGEQAESAGHQDVRVRDAAAGETPTSGVRGGVSGDSAAGPPVPVRLGESTTVSFGGVGGVGGGVGVLT